MGVHIYADDEEPLYLSAVDAYSGIPGGASGTARKAPSPSSSGDGTRISDRAPHSEGAGSDREPAPFGLITIEPGPAPAIVIRATAQRIVVHPDFAEEFGLKLIRAAAEARLSKSLMRSGPNTAPLSARSSKPGGE